MRQKIAKHFNWLKTHPNKWVRWCTGILLVIGGLFGILPVLGFWMLPLGLILLSADFPWARRLNRRLAVLSRRSWAAVKQRLSK